MSAREAHPVHCACQLPKNGRLVFAEHNISTGLLKVVQSSAKNVVCGQKYVHQASHIVTSSSGTQSVRNINSRKFKSFHWSRMSDANTRFPVVMFNTKMTERTVPCPNRFPKKLCWQRSACCRCCFCCASQTRNAQTLAAMCAPTLC